MNESCSASKSGKPRKTKLKQSLGAGTGLFFLRDVSRSDHFKHFILKTMEVNVISQIKDDLGVFLAVNLL